MAERKHAWKFKPEGETPTDVVFACANCGTECGFNKPGVGEPAAVQTASGWLPHADVDSYVGPCEAPP